MRDIAGAVESGLTILCSAPAGMGKTVASLYPTLQHAVRTGGRVFFATAKNSQQQLALDTLRAMLDPADGIVAVQIPAKERSCPMDGRRCSQPRCRMQERTPERLQKNGLLEELAVSGVVDGATIVARALAARVCPFETALALAESASAIVSDLNYVFEPNAYLRRFFDVPYDRDLLIVDEAHNLPARASAHYSPELNLETLRAIADECLFGGEPAVQPAGLVLAELLDACDQTWARLGEERGDAPPWVEAPDLGLYERLAEPVADAIGAYQSFRSAGGRSPLQRAGLRPDTDARGRDPLLVALYALRDLGRFCAREPERFACLWSPGRLRVLCLDPAPFLRERVRGFRAAVFMSATLSPVEFYARRLGVDGPDTVSLDLPSPFPKTQRLLAAVTSVDTTYAKRSEDAEHIARIIADVIALRPGNYLAFFPSYAYRDEVIAKLPSGDHRVLLQLPGLPAETTLGLLRNNPGDTRLLAGVHGGIFAEGVDYPGDMAIGVFVIGPGLPQVSPEQELIRSYYDRELGAGFEYAYVYPGLNRVVQAGGRPLRTETDRAFTLLLGRRFAQKLYRDKLPLYWQDELVELADPVAAVRAFWES
jgi:Rad3-related DNA helicase